MQEVIMLVGNIGSGKSVIAHKYIQRGYITVSMDLLQSSCHNGEYNYYDSQLKSVYHLLEEMLLRESLKLGKSVIIDRTNMTKAIRKRYIDIIKEYHVDITCINFGRGGNENLERRMKNPRELSRDAWLNIFNNFRNIYEEPEINEGFSQIIEAPKRYKMFAVDFDGTIVENDFPKIGKIHDDCILRIRKLSEDISNVIIVWSCRSGDYELQMEEFLLKNNIPHDFINNNPLFDVGSRKIYADVYIDDRGEQYPDPRVYNNSYSS